MSETPDVVEVEFPLEDEAPAPDVQQQPSIWRNRIVGSGMMAPDQFLANPNNFRIHSAMQESALEEVLDRVGWVRTVLVNRTTGHVLDGHLRVALGIRRGEAEIPYDLVDITEAEEKLVLAALDPIAGMAGTDHEKLAGLLAELQIDLGGSLHAMLTELEEASRPKPPEAPLENKKDHAGQLKERFGVPPFSILNAREGWRQSRKAAWISLGLRSELGRGGNLIGRSATEEEYRKREGRFAKSYGCGGPADLSARYKNQQNHAAPGGSAMPSMNYSKDKARGDGRGRPLPKEPA